MEIISLARIKFCSFIRVIKTSTKNKTCQLTSGVSERNKWQSTNILFKKKKEEKKKIGNRLRPDFISNLVHELAFGTPKFYTAPYGKIKRELVNLSSKCDVKSGLRAQKDHFLIDKMTNKYTTNNERSSPYSCSLSF